MFDEQPAIIGGFVVGGLYTRKTSRGKGHMGVLGPCSRHQDCDRCISYVECWWVPTRAGEKLFDDIGCAEASLLKTIFEPTPFDKEEQKEQRTWQNPILTTQPFLIRLLVDYIKTRITLTGFSLFCDAAKKILNFLFAWKVITKASLESGITVPQSST